MGHFQLPHSYNIIFQVCIFLGLLSYGVVKFVTVGNYYIYLVGFFDGFVKYNYVRSTVITIMIIILYW